MKIFFVVAIFVAVGLSDALQPVGVAFKGDNGKYLSRIRRGGIDFIEMAKPQKDPYTRFLAEEINGKLVLRADNGKFLSRIHRLYQYGYRNVDFIEAFKTDPDVYSQFTVHSQPDGTVVLQADNGKYMSRINRYVSAYRTRVDFYEAEKDKIDQYCKLKLEFQL